jgi:hypothetical protein
MSDLVPPPMLTTGSASQSSYPFSWTFCGLRADNDDYVQSAELSSHAVTKVLRIISKTTAMVNKLRVLQRLGE